jgi:hypothetical protein
MSKASGIVKGFGASIGGIASSMLPLATGLTGVLAAVKGVAEVGQAFGDIDRIAKSAQKFGVTTEAMVGLEHAAELSGISVEQLDGAMKRASRNGTSLEAIADKIAATSDPTERAQIAFKELGKSGQDMIPMLSGGGEALREMMDEGNRLAGFSGVDAAKVEAANDAITRMQLAFTGIARDLAIELAPAVEMIAVGVQKVGELGRAAFGTVKDFAIDAFLVAEFGWTHMGEIATLAWNTIKLGGIGFFEDMKFMFTDQLPALVTWFGDQWGNIWFAAINNSLSLLINFGQNIRDFFSSVWEFISSGGENWNFVPTNLTDGFQAAFDKLPDIPQRALTDLEKSLQSEIDSMSGGLLDGLGEHMLAGRAAIAGPEGTPVSPGAAGGGAGDLKDLKGPAAAQRGSAEAFSSIFSAMRGGGGDPQEQTAKNTKQTADDTRQLLREARRQSKAEPVQLVAGTA